MLTYTPLVLLALACSGTAVAGSIVCYECTNVANISDCHTPRECPQYHSCFTSVIGHGSSAVFTLGCRPTDHCPSTHQLPWLPGGNTNVGRSVVSSACNQCCNVDACNRNLCSMSTHVHGGWTLWSPWGSCSATCGVGLRRRDRSCTNPYPSHGDDNCIGDTRDDKVCMDQPCTDGVWTAWGLWEHCSTSCGPGFKTRTRSCTNPPPSPFGHDCVGLPLAVVACNDRICQELPKIDVFPTQTTYALGSTVNLTCDSSNSQATSIVWDRVDTTACPQSSLRSNNDVISSLQPSDLGKYRCTAIYQYGSVSKTITIRTNDTAPLDCDFESACTWENGHHTDTSDWLTGSGPTPSRGTGPYADHTLGTNTTLTGHYLFIESSNDNEGDTAEYQSLQLPASNGSCLTFWYNMYGPDIGTLNVYVEPCIGARKQVFQLTGDKGQGWTETRIQLTAMDTLLDHTIIIQSIHGPGVQGDTAIDDIVYSPGTCRSTLRLTGPADTPQTAVMKSTATLTCPATGIPTPTRTWTKVGGCGYDNYTGDTLVLHDANYGTAGTYICTMTNGLTTLNKTIHLSIYAPPSYEDRCTFEGVNFCDWTQETSGADQFDWTMQQGYTPSSDTGPDNDHTLNSASGHYIYIETSSPRHRYDQAKLISHLMPRNQSACFSFWYNMYGSEIGQLTVYKQDQCTKHVTSLWSKSGAQGRKWIRAAIDIFDQSHDYVIVVVGTTGYSYQGDIGIDELVITDAHCVAIFFDCDFDRSICTWTQSTSDQMDWSRAAGQTPTIHTGPDGDHTGLHGNGHYMFIESSGRTHGDSADLVSHVIPGGHDYCFHLATNMYGSGIGSIEILVQLQPPGSGVNVIQTFSSASPSPVWVERKVDLPATNDDFRIIVRGNVGTTSLGDAAIDDIKLHSGKCH